MKENREIKPSIRPENKIILDRINAIPSAAERKSTALSYLRIVDETLSTTFSNGNGWFESMVELRHHVGKIADRQIESKK